jgi:hypothetical protein
MRQNAATHKQASISVPLSVFRRETQNQVNALKFVNPFSGDGGERRIVGKDEAGGTGRADLSGGKLSVAGERAVTEPGDFLTFFIEPKDHRNAVAAVDAQGRADLFVGVTIDEPKIDEWRGGRDMIEDRALVDAIAAPGTRHA